MGVWVFSQIFESLVGWVPPSVLLLLLCLVCAPPPDSNDRGFLVFGLVSVSKVVCSSRVL